MDNALAPSTRKVYQKSVGKFREFCQGMDIDLIDDEALELWVTHLSDEGVTPGVIKSHISALRNYSLKQKLPLHLDNPRLKLLLKGSEKSKSRHVARPVATLSHVIRLVKAAKACYHNKNYREITAMITLAFFGFLRPSEYCITKAGHNLRWKDVQFSRNNKSVKLSLRSYKHSQGQSKVYLSKVKECCPVEHLNKYRGTFAHSHGEALFNVTAKEFEAKLKSLLKSANIKTHLTPHSLRHGGATWASQQGWPDARIKAHGRWRSDAYKRYVHAL